MKRIILSFLIVVIIIASLFGLSACEKDKDYAYLEAKRFNVSLIVDGNVYLTIPVKENENFSFPISPTKTGYDFVGWYEDNNLTTEYDFSTKVTDNLTLYAKFEKKVYAVTLHYNNGNQNDVYYVAHGNTFDIPTQPTKKNCLFNHWSYDSVYDREYDFASTVTSNIDLYARYKLDGYLIDALNINYKVITTSYNTFLGITTSYAQKTGSGIIYKQTGSNTYYLLTNNHVIMKDEDYDKVRYEIMGDDGKTYTATLIKNDANYDLAILKFVCSSETYVVPFATNNPAEGDDIVAVGYPKGNYSVTFGYVAYYNTVTINDSSPSESNVQFPIIVHTAKTDHGSSGGAIINSNFELVGIHYAGAHSSNYDYGYAIPIQKIREFISD